MPPHTDTPFGERWQLADYRYGDGSRRDTHTESTDLQTPPTHLPPTHPHSVRLALSNSPHPLTRPVLCRCFSDARTL